MDAWGCRLLRTSLLEHVLRAAGAAGYFQHSRSNALVRTELHLHLKQHQQLLHGYSDYICRSFPTILSLALNHPPPPGSTHRCPFYCFSFPPTTRYLHTSQSGHLHMFACQYTHTYVSWICRLPMRWTLQASYREPPLPSPPLPSPSPTHLSLDQGLSVFPSKIMLVFLSCHMLCLYIMLPCAALGYRPACWRSGCYKANHLTLPAR